MKKSQVILLSDSNSGHLELMEIAIRKVLKNAQIVRVSAMDECLRLLPDIFLDLVILNLVAGSRTELDMLAKIHAFNPCLPILIITGQGNEKAVVRAMKSSVHDYLIKSTGYLTTLPVTVTRILRETEEKCSLYQTEQYYKDLVENASDGIYLLDDAGYIRLVNKMCAQKTGYKRNQLIGRHFSFLFSEEDQKKLLYKVKRNQKLKRVIKYQTSILCTSEKRLPVELSIIPVKSNETVIGYQGIIRDVSEEIRLQEERKKRTEEIQRMNEELMEKNKKLNELHQLKTQFISNVGHELRTPLTSILGYTELLREGVYGQLESGQEKAVQNINYSGNHLLNLINELLEVAKIQSGKYKIYKEPTSVYNLVEAAINTIRPSIDEKQIRIVTSLPENLPGILIDAQKIFQVLLNLLSNAAKFTMDGEIEIKLFQKQGQVYFVIRDTGIGIPRDELANIFREFHQVDRSLTRQFGGTGLGLSLAKYLVELHGGKIWVESVPEKGSAFFFTLPVSSNLEQNQTIENGKQNMTGDVARTYLPRAENTR